jgi:hypothetical protein
MDIVVLKSEEDSMLAYCDDSCVNGDNCVCKTKLGMKKAGQGMYHYGINKCVLCCRNDAHHPSYPYRVVVDGYPKEWVVGGVFIRFNPCTDYITDGQRVIKQNVGAFHPTCPDTWVTKLYNTAVTKIPTTSNRWFVAVCETDWCKSLIHSYINEHRAIGISDSYMDLSTDTVKCRKCDLDLILIHDSNGLVCYKGITYARCRFCFTIIHYKSTNAIQICTTCLHEQENELKVLERVCVYCKNTVPINKRGGSQKLRVRCTDGDTCDIKEMFLCRHHKMKNIQGDQIVEYDTLSTLFNIKTT